MTDTNSVLYSLSGSIATLTLNRPDVLNSFNRDMALRLQELLKQCARDEAVRCVVMTAVGKGFSAGQDLNEFLASTKGTPKLAETVEKSFNPIVRAIREIEKPVVCALNGVAAGAGANIALACDFVVAAESATLIQSFSKIGLVPDSGGTFFLPRLAGLAKATELIMLGERLTAAEAFELGLIYKVVPELELHEQAMMLATRLADMPTRALGLSKRLLNASAVNSLSEQLELERDVQDQAGRTDDFKEGVDAFLGKRNPRYKGT
jgi:2-(1,2-epoxy-1,2-dihydrophenyl)acetyl-CoA isomerase